MPFGGALIAGAASLIPAGIKLFKGISQRKQAKKLKQVDVTPEAVKAKVAAANQAASSGRMAGQDQAEGRIAQGTSAQLAAASQGATSGGSLLASLGRSNQARLGALNDLSLRATAWQDQKKRELGSAQTEAGQWQDQGRREFNNAKSSLLEAGDRNIMGAATDVANGIAFGASKAMDFKNPSAATSVESGSTDMFDGYRRRARKSGMVYS